MNALAGLVMLGDVDLLLEELEDAASRQRLRKLGFALEGLPRLGAARERVAGTVERRWLVAYERARQRYGRGITAVRDRVCLGCFVTMPTAAARPAMDADTPELSGAPGLCASCGRILYWG